MSALSHFRTFPRRCLECDVSFDALSERAEFCGTLCRRAWNLRRERRGAALYDLFMALRWDRERAKTLKLWRLVNRMASEWRAEDRRERGGRLSWREPDEVRQRHVPLVADVVWRGRAE